MRCASDPFGSTIELSAPHAAASSADAATRQDDAGAAAAHRGRFQYDGPTGSVKSDCAMTNPSSSTASGSCGSAAAAGPNTGFAPVSTSNADWWHGHSSWCALRLVQADRAARVRAHLRVADQSFGRPRSRPGGRSSASGSTRMSTTWPSAEPGGPRGKIVTRPSTGTSDARTGRPSSVIARKPFAPRRPLERVARARSRANGSGTGTRLRARRARRSSRRSTAGGG